MTYGLIDNDQLAANILRMSTPWCPPTSIDTLFKKIKSCKKFAADVNEPISDSTAICTAVIVIK